MTDTVRVDLGARSYDVRIGQGLLARAGTEIAPLLRRKRVAVLTETRVAAAHLDALRAGLAAEGIAMEAHALPPGEGTKGWAGLEEAVEWLLDAEGRAPRRGRGLRRRRHRRPRGLRRRRSCAGASGSCRSRRRCWRRSTAPSAARPASTPATARTSWGPSTSPRSCWPTSASSTRCRPATSSRATARS